MRERVLGFECEFEIASRKPGMFARERFRPRTFPVLNGLHNRAMLLGRNESLALFEVGNAKHQSFGSRKRYFAGMLQLPKKRRTLCKPPQFAVKLLVSFQVLGEPCSVMGISMTASERNSFSCTSSSGSPRRSAATLRPCLPKCREFQWRRECQQD